MMYCVYCEFSGSSDGIGGDEFANKRCGGWWAFIHWDQAMKEWEDQVRLVGWVAYWEGNKCIVPGWFSIMGILRMRFDWPE